MPRGRENEDRSESSDAGALIDEGRLRRLFDSGIVGVVSWDTTGAIHDANDKFLEMFGYTREDITARRLEWQSLGLAESVSAEACALPRVHESADEPTDKAYRRKDGTRVFVRLRSIGFEDDPTKVFSVVVDISAQKRAEAERDGHLESERRARAEAEAAVRAREEILAIVSHDLRNPLNSIALGVGVIEGFGLGNGVDTQVGIVRRAVGRMSRLIEDLLDVSQITSGRLEVRPVEIDLPTLIDEMRLVLEPQIVQKSQHFDYERPGPVRVLADPHRMSQVLANLIGNASKFTPEGGRITLRVHCDDGDAVVSVSDTGHGIDAQDLPNIFDRFWQARRVRRGGVGLGLPIAKGIIDAHRGRIWVESSPGRGTTFFFTLRLATRAFGRSRAADRQC